MRTQPPPSPLADLPLEIEYHSGTQAKVGEFYEPRLARGTLSRRVVGCFTNRAFSVASHGTPNSMVKNCGVSWRMGTDPANSGTRGTQGGGTA
jgi:hypothetical protein